MRPTASPAALSQGAPRVVISKILYLRDQGWASGHSVDDRHGKVEEFG